jgi:conserved oligomeric Golgi complex subunit 2
MAPPATDLFGEPIEAHQSWFKPDSFLRADFDLDAYVTGLRSYVPLESLAAELRSHLAALRAELVGLINRDYVDFVGLSARLKCVDAAATRMRAPLADLWDKVAAFRVGASAALAALCAGLEQRAAATAAHKLLELPLDTSQRHRRRPRHPERAAPSRQSLSSNAALVLLRPRLCLRKHHPGPENLGVHTNSGLKPSNGPSPEPPSANRATMVSATP